MDTAQETIKVRRAGYPFRYLLGDFLARYWPLLGAAACAAGAGAFPSVEDLNESRIRQMPHH